jgi:hypothetical protein
MFAVAAVDGAQVNGLQVTLSGPTTVVMSCSPSGSAMTCTAPDGYSSAGPNLLQVTATGLQPVRADAFVTVSMDGCCCTLTTLRPSAVALNPV